MVENRRDADHRGDLIAEFETLAEQDARAQLFAVRWGTVQIPVMECAAEAAIGEDAVAVTEQVLDQHDPPGQPEIAVAGIAAGVDVAADMRARRSDIAKQVGRIEQQLDIDVGAALDMMIK